MYKLHAAIQVDVLMNNVPGQISPIGEFSTYTQTYSREIGSYAKDEYAGINLLSFSSLQDGEQVEVPNDTATLVLQIAQWLYGESIAGNLSDNKVDCQNALQAQFTDTVLIDELGEMATDGTYYLPSRVEFSVVGQDSEIKLWFADSAMRNEYELYEIQVIGPVINLDDLHKANATVQTTLQNESNVSRFLEKAKELADDTPYTKFDTVQYDWLSKTDSNVSYVTDWGIIIWGQAGNNADVIRATVAQYILDNSITEQSEWEKIYPDIFRPTEFYILPIWDRVSLGNQSGLNKVYSPTLPVVSVDDYVDGFQDIARSHIDEHGLILSTAYKGLMVLTVGNSTNRDDVFGFLEVWPDYVNIPTTHVDFNRISPATQDFIIQMVNMIIQAEGYTEETQLPTSMTMVARSGIQYIASTYNNILYLVRVSN